MLGANSFRHGIDTSQSTSVISGAPTMSAQSARPAKNSDALSIAQTLTTSLKKSCLTPFDRSAL